jgi:hypothetical protein
VLSSFGLDPRHGPPQGALDGRAGPVVVVGHEVRIGMAADVSLDPFAAFVAGLATPTMGDDG